MTYTFKLARRAAGLCASSAFGTSLLFAGALVTGCNSDDSTGPAPVENAVETAVDQAPTLQAATGDAAATTQIVITPGTNIQSKVKEYPAGTQFLIKAGTYYNQTIVPKTGNVFIGEAGAILDGRNTTSFAFDKGGAPYPSNVRIKGLTIQNYAPPDQQGAISGAGNASQSTRGWVIESCEVRYNKYAGIKIGDKMTLLNNYVHHNGQIGISGTGDSVLVTGNEIAFNNYQKTFSFGKVLGGAKFVSTKGLIVRGNNVHDNQGNGIWLDIDNIKALVENNVSNNNSGAGFMTEIGYSTVIRNNTAKGNGYARDWVTGAGILISATADVEVYGNTVLDNKQGIVAIQQNRTKNGVNYSSNLKNLYVHDNTIRVLAGGVTGLASGVGDLPYTSRNNRFTHNTYDVGADAKTWTWKSAKRTKKEWQGFGNDVTGIFN